MSNLHPIFEQALRPFAPINDDDIYLVDIGVKRIIKRVGNRSDMRNQTYPVGVGQALLPGLTAKWYQKEGA